MSRSHTDTPPPPPATLDYANVRSPRPPRRVRAFVWQIVAVVGIVYLGAYTLMPTRRTSPEMANRIKRAANLRQIAIACIMYAGANGGRFPDTIGSAIADTDLSASPETAVCWSTRDTLAPGPTTREVRRQMDAGPPPGSVGRGLTTAAAGPRHVLAYEPPSNHAGAGGQVVYADASVEWHGTKELNRIIAAVQAGQNPPPAAGPGGR